MRPKSVSAGQNSTVTGAERLRRFVPPHREDSFHSVQIEKRREVDRAAELHHGTVKDTGRIPLLSDGSERVENLQQRLKKAVHDADEGLPGAAPSGQCAFVVQQRREGLTSERLVVVEPDTCTMYLPVTNAESGVSRAATRREADEERRARVEKSEGSSMGLLLSYRSSGGRFRCCYAKDE